MPRSPRNARGGVVYHALNRGNGRLRLFHKPADYDDFLALLARAKAAVPGMRVLAYCLMPNHWHLVLLPRRDGDLSRFLQRLLTSHVRRHHAHRGGAAAGAAGAGTAGHLYQGRSKTFPVQDDRHLLTLLRYVESNPLRARPPLARSPAGWKWCSFAARAGGGPPWGAKGDRKARAGAGAGAGADAMPLLDEWPVAMPRDWEALVREPLDELESEAVLASLRRGRPFGDPRWAAAAAEALGLNHTLNPRGRPPKRRPQEPPAREAPRRPGTGSRTPRKR